MLERRERILAAARELVGGGGEAALTMRALARAARVTVPTIYNLIGGKDEVLFAAVEDQTRRFVAGLEAARGQGPAERCVGVADACVRELLRLPRWYRELLLLFVTSEAAGRLRTRVTRALRAGFADALGAMRERGQLADWADVDAVAAQLTVQLTMTALQWAGGGLGEAQLRAAAPYGACLLLLGVARGPARDALEKRAARLQARLAARGAGRERARRPARPRRQGAR